MNLATAFAMHAGVSERSYFTWRVCVRRAGVAELAQQDSVASLLLSRCHCVAERDRVSLDTNCANHPGHALSPCFIQLKSSALLSGARPQVK